MMRSDAPVFHLIPASFMNHSSPSPSPDDVTGNTQMPHPQVADLDKAVIRMQSEHKSPDTELLAQSLFIGGGKQKKRKAPKRTPSPKKRSKAAGKKKPAAKRTAVKKKKPATTQKKKSKTSSKKPVSSKKK